MKPTDLFPEPHNVWKITPLSFPILGLRKKQARYWPNMFLLIDQPLFRYLALWYPATWECWDMEVSSHVWKHGYTLIYPLAIQHSCGTSPFLRGKSSEIIYQWAISIIFHNFHNKIKMRTTRGYHGHWNGEPLLNSKHFCRSLWVHDSSAPVGKEDIKYRKWEILWK